MQNHHGTCLGNLHWKVANFRFKKILFVCLFSRCGCHHWRAHRRCIPSVLVMGTRGATVGTGAAAWRACGSVDASTITLPHTQNITPNITPNILVPLVEYFLWAAGETSAVLISRPVPLKKISSRTRERDFARKGIVLIGLSRPVLDHPAQAFRVVDR